MAPVPMVVGTPFSLASSREPSLLPSRSIASAGGPMKAMPAVLQAREKAGRSLRKP